MIKCYLFLTLSLSFAFINVTYSQSLLKPLDDDMSKYTSVGNIGLTVSNIGTFGHAWNLPNQPNCEYPKDSKVEHLYLGGLWVGALKEGTIQVTTGAVEYGSVSNLGAGFEFTSDTGDVTIERSQYNDSPYYDPIYAISHQDFVADFSDTNRIVPGTTIQIPDHNPLGISVHLETYAWDFPFADDFVIFNYEITNESDVSLDSMYIGMWADLVVRNTNISPPRIGGPYYRHGGSGRIDSLHMIYCYDLDGDPEGTSDSYVAIKLLGGEQADGSFYNLNSKFNWWTYRNSSGDDYLQSPNEDEECWQRLKFNTSSSDYYQFIRPADPTNPSTPPIPGNRMSLISTGPFDNINPGESINIVFSVVCAPKSGSDARKYDTALSKKELEINSEWSAIAYHGEDKNRNGILDFVGTDSTEDLDGNGRITRYVLPTPPLPPNLKVVPVEGKVTLFWDKIAENSRDLITGFEDFEGYRIYRSKLGEDIGGIGLLQSMQLVAEYDLKNKIGYDIGLDSIRMSPEEIFTEINYNQVTGLFDTITYCYKKTFENLIDGWQYSFAVTSFDSGDVSINLPSLESSLIKNATYVFPGSPPRTDSKKYNVNVFPNPYRSGEIWDGKYERERKIHFYNLPGRCEIRIYTLAGDLIDSFEHNSGYAGNDIKWFEKFSGDNKVFPGGLHAWDLVTADDQAIATGLYFYTVKNLDSGEIQKGKFAIIK